MLPRSRIFTQMEPADGEGGSAATEDSACTAIAELDAIHQQKIMLKKAIREWEIEFEETHYGLVPTHEDKKMDVKYQQIKAKAKSVDKLLEQTRTKTRDVRQATRASRQDTAPAANLSAMSKAGSRKAFDGSSSSFASMWSSSSSMVQGRASSPSFKEEAQRNEFRFESGHISLSPFHVLQLTFACVIPYAIFIAGFALFGMGALVFDYLVSSGRFFYPLSLSAVGLLFALYIFDVSYWEHPLSVISRRLLLSIAGATVVVGGTLASKEYPYAPMLMLFFLAPGYWWLLKSRCFHAWPLNQYLQALSISLMLISLGAATLWVTWVLNGNNWDLANKRESSQPRDPLSPATRTAAQPSENAAALCPPKTPGSPPPPSSPSSHRLAPLPPLPLPTLTLFQADGCCRCAAAIRSRRSRSSCTTPAIR